MNNIALPTVIALLVAVGGAYAYELSRQDDVHKVLVESQVAGDVELDLSRVKLELKLIRTIKERRPLTADELDRRRYLEALRSILLTQQRAKIG